MTDGCRMSREAKRTTVPGREDGHSGSSSEVHHFCSANPLRIKEALLPTSEEDGGGATRNPRGNTDFGRGQVGSWVLRDGTDGDRFLGAPTFRTRSIMTGSSRGPADSGSYGEGKHHKKKKSLPALSFGQTGQNCKLDGGKSISSS